jgi:hypothetical protein
MRAGNLLLLLGALVVAAFSLLNWGVIVAETPISLGFAQVQAPMGLILLGAMVSVAMLALLLLFIQQARALKEYRRSEKALQAQRELADKAEASRFVDLSRHLDESFEKWQASWTGAMASQNQHREAFEQRVLERLDEENRALSALLGEIEDKLDRHLAQGGTSVSGPG